MSQFTCILRVQWARLYPNLSQESQDLSADLIQRSLPVYVVSYAARYTIMIRQHLQSKMPSIHKLHNHVWDVSLERLRTRRNKGRVVLAPYS